jgi:AraC-like DNA-binding protein
MTPWNPLGPDQLIAELTARAPQPGANTGSWPGLTIYKSTGPTERTWGESNSLLLCILVQGREAATIGSETYLYGPLQYVIIGSHVRIEFEILEASAERPFLSFVLQIDPGLVRRLSTEMPERRITAMWSSQFAAFPVQDAFASAVDGELLEVAVRFLRATRTDMDCRVLAPLYLQELIYRVLQREQYIRLLDLADAESTSSPIPMVIQYVREHMAEPLTVSTMADLASLSPSAFAHLFREVTGRPPHQFLKQLRLDRARELLADGTLPVTRISREVGYASVSHFISEFRGRFGMTPHSYTVVTRANGSPATGTGNISAGTWHPQG